MNPQDSNGARGATLYWPYDEVVVRVTEPGREARVESPWLSARVALDPSNAEGVEALASKFATGSLTSDDLALVQWFFSPFSALPFCYVLPTPKGLEAIDAHAVVDCSLSGTSLQGLLERAAAEPVPSEDDAGDSDPASLASRVSGARAEWEWDSDAALAFAGMPEGKVHPESLLSVARRFHLLDVLSQNEGRSHFTSIESMSGEEFRLAAGLMVRQNHYVTRQCRDSLLPAVSLAQGVRGAVEDFIAEENGHDVLLGGALDSLVGQRESLPVSAETRVLMRLLRYAASRNLLAFAMAVDCFERNTYEESDPLATLLRRGGFEKAATYVSRHKSINDAGGHENVAAGFLATMAPCEPTYALEALRIAEAVSVVINRVPASAMALLESTKV